MKNCYLDANVLIAFVDQSNAHHLESKSLIELLTYQNIALVTSSLALDEFFFVVQFLAGRKNKKRIFEGMQIMFNSISRLPTFTILNPPVSIENHGEIIKYMEQFTLKPRDAYHLLTATHHTVSYFATFDNDFKTVFAKGVLQKFSVSVDK